MKKSLATKHHLLSILSTFSKSFVLSNRLVDNLEESRFVGFQYGFSSFRLTLDPLRIGGEKTVRVLLCLILLELFAVIDTPCGTLCMIALAVFYHILSLTELLFKFSVLLFLMKRMLIKSY